MRCGACKEIRGAGASEAGVIHRRYLIREAAFLTPFFNPPFSGFIHCRDYTARVPAGPRVEMRLRATRREVLRGS